VTRHLYLAAGLFCMALGAVGVFLPVLPTVPFLLLAVFCFTRSRPEWAERLYAHPRYGAPLRRWRDRRAISRKAKVSALTAMSVSAARAWTTMRWTLGAADTLVLLGAGTWIATRRE
jgi:uncharacterized membrane protein YbaN (DUF454 family)